MSLIEQFKRDYQRNGGKPVPVALRDMIKRDGVNKYPHLIHPYTAKLIPHIPHMLFSNEEILPRGSKVLDPFSGSGTVLLEALLNGHRCLGADSNPLARLITKVKLTPLSYDTIKTDLDSLLKKIPDKPSGPLPRSSINIDYWFYPHVISVPILVPQRQLVTEVATFF